MENTYLCPRCLVNDPHEGRLNSIKDIAFSMPAEFYRQLHESIIQVEANIERIGDTTELLSKRLSGEDRFKCITLDDIESCMSFRKKRETMYDGIWTLDIVWLKEKLTWLGIEDYDLSGVENVTLLDVRCSFYYTRSTDGTLIPKEIRDGSENIVSDERRCGKCGRLLSPDIGKAQEIRILLQGNSRAGKSSCIVSAVDWMLRMRKAGIEVRLCERDLRQDDSHYHNWIHEELENYRAGYKVKKTPIAQKEPGMFSVLVKVNDELRVLTFIDMPGEFFESPSDGQDGLFLQYRPIYRCCDIVWTCMQYEVLAQKPLTGQQISRMEDQTSLTEKQLEKALGYYIARLRVIMSYLKDNGIHSFPYHAVILTKSDAVSDYQDRLEERRVFSADPKNLKDALTKYRRSEGDAGVLALDEFKFHHFANDVRRFFVESQKENDDNMCQIMEEFSQNTRYFAMSSYGHYVVEKDAPPSETKRPCPPTPYHTQLPLLWAMTAFDQLPVCYDVNLKEELSALGRMITGERYRDTGKTKKDCTVFSRAGKKTVDNLLKNNPIYQEHERII